MYRCVDAMVPGFGGFYRDEHGVMTVVLSDPGQLRQAVHAVYVAGLGNLDLRKTRAVRGAFSYTQLSNWQMALTRVIFGIPGVTNIGQQLVHNRLSIGVATDEAKRRVLEIVTKLRIPANAVVFGPAIVGRSVRGAP
jgi:hypothetical protein